MRAKFYDNGNSLEIGISASDKSILYFESKYEESELPAYIVELSKKRLKNLSIF